MLTFRAFAKAVPVWLWLPVALGALVAGGYYGIWQPIEHHYLPRNWGVVEEGWIYRSGEMPSGLIRDALAENKIKVLITLVAQDPQDPEQIALERAVKELAIDLKRFPMQGDGTPGEADQSQGIAKYADAVAAIAQARREGKPVLVQCGAGTHRTGGIVATYRMLVQRMPASYAYAELCDYGWNPAKHGDLLKFLNPAMGAIAAKLVELGVIPEVPKPLPVLGPS
ncbi:MAG: dual specificity protein phosphatase family protein [Planctomycetaceae bacterium]|nr:dual specificity protein phosphatase family protein [Planctomycetaceae bacterium]